MYKQRFKKSWKVGSSIFALIIVLISFQHCQVENKVLKKIPGTPGIPVK